MQDAAGNYPQAMSRNDHHLSVVSDLMSLIEHMQASMKMLELAIAREMPACDSQAYDTFIVLDDITPCYVKANTALYNCKARLGAALHCLLATEPPQHGAGEVAERKRGPADWINGA